MLKFVHKYNNVLSRSLRDFIIHIFNKGKKVKHFNVDILNVGFGLYVKKVDNKLMISI